MKREYRKPMVVFENFTLCTSIAGSCQVKTNTPSQGTCPYVVTQGLRVYNIFTSEMVGICTTTEAADGTADGAYNGICYHVFTDNTLFNS